MLETFFFCFREWSNKMSDLYGTVKTGKLKLKGEKTEKKKKKKDKKRKHDREAEEEAKKQKTLEASETAR